MNNKKATCRCCGKEHRISKWGMFHKHSHIDDKGYRHTCAGSHCTPDYLNNLPDDAPELLNLPKWRRDLNRRSRPQTNRRSHTPTNELRTQADELRTQADELRAQAQALLAQADELRAKADELLAR